MLPAILQASRLRVEGLGALVSGLLSGLFYRVGLAFLALGAADFLLQRFFYMKKMRMSKEEVKLEYKQLAGDPEVKMHRRRLYHQLMAEGGVHNVPSAAAVVVNPTHYAVALRYEEAMGAPQIAARGVDEVARAIVAAARAADVGIVENAPLARELYKSKVGQEIPEDLYEAVNIILQQVHELAQQKATQ